MLNECNMTTESFQTIFRMNTNTATETLPTEIQHNDNMTTEWDHRMGPPTKIELDHQVYRIVYRMASRDSQDNYQEIITVISQRKMSLPKDFIWRSTELITGSSTVSSH